MTRTRKQSLIDEKASLQRRLKEIDTELVRINDAPGSVRRDPAAKTAVRTAKPAKATRPLREIVMNILGETNCMLNNTIIRQLYEARYQKNLAGSRLGSLSHDELVRKNTRNTTLFGLIHPIQLVGNNVMPIKNVWARSDWPREERVFTPCTDTLIHLRFLDWYLRMRNSNGYQYLKSPAFLRFAEGFIDYVGLKNAISIPINTVQARKTVVCEITRVEEIEASKYSELIFRVLLAHKRAKKKK